MYCCKEFRRIILIARRYMEYIESQILKEVSSKGLFCAMPYTDCEYFLCVDFDT